MNIWSLDPDGSGEESKAGDLAQNFTQNKVKCKPCHHFSDVMVFFENEGRTQTKTNIIANSLKAKIKSPTSSKTLAPHSKDMFYWIEPNMFSFF